jgi:4-hydroxy-tetrahydrodipicolinate synthase
MHSGSLDIDWGALKKLVEWHIEQGTNSIVAVGTTGESATLDVSEHSAVIRAVVEQVAGRIPVIAGTGANSTREAIELTKAAKEAGADACLLVTPYYNKPTQEGLYLHHKAIAEAVAIDQILYNVPGRTACDMQIETVLRLSAIGNIVGIKEATGDLQRAEQLIAQCPADFAVYSGDDHTARELMLLGGSGDISVTANVAPKLMSEMCAAALAGDSALAAELDGQLIGLHDAMFVEANPIPVKWAVSQLGLMENSLRLPMTALSDQHHQQVAAALNDTQLI